jgi:DNA primase large subunit
MPAPLHPPRITDPVVLARFPFLPQGEQWIKELRKQNEVDLDSLVNADWLAEARARGTLRMLESIVHDKGIDADSRVDIHTDYGQMVEGLGYYYAMFVVCASLDELLLKRWVEGEATRADNLLSTTSDAELFDTIARTYLSDLRRHDPSEGESATSPLHSPRSRARDDRSWEIPLTDFVELAPRITGSYWRLTNRPVSAGWVLMNGTAREDSQGRLSRLIKERIRVQLIARCQANISRMDEQVTAMLAEPVGMIVAELQTQRGREVQVTAAEKGDWPPCMLASIAELNIGENVNHAGRRFLANMSRALGLPPEQCAGFFVNAPDYDEKTTNYQVAQIYEAEYTPEKCDTLALNNRCPVASGLIDDSLCRREWLTHPLKYVRVRQRARQRDAQVAVAQDAPDAVLDGAEEAGSDGADGAEVHRMAD